MRRLILAASILLAGLLPPAPTSFGQEMDASAVSLDQLLFMPEVYGNKLVRISGELDVIPSRRGHVYSLRGAYGLRLLLYAEPGIAQSWTLYAPRFVGREVELTGQFSQAPPDSARDAPPVLTDPDTGLAPFYLRIRTFRGPPDEEAVRKRTAEVALEDMGANPEAFLGRELTVIGQFRGYNLFGDLPAESRPGALDWVLKDGAAALWVTGKKPEGDGWRLDPASKSDSAKWVQVKGRVRMAGGVAVIRATYVALVSGR